MEGYFAECFIEMGYFDCLVGGCLEVEFFYAEVEGELFDESFDFEEV